MSGGARSPADARDARRRAARRPNLVYEPKYDGIRALVADHAPGGRRRREVAIASRLGNDKTAQFPEIVAALDRWGAGGARRRSLLDGEIVALDPGGPAGRASSACRIASTSAARASRGAPAKARGASWPSICCATATRTCARSPWPSGGCGSRRCSPGREGRRRFASRGRCAGDGDALMAEARAEGWEGIVAKDARSTYRSGRRTLEWRKLKLVKRQELVVGGFTEPRGSRSALRRAAGGRCPRPGRAALRGARRRRLQRGRAGPRGAPLATPARRRAPFDERSRRPTSGRTGCVPGWSSRCKFAELDRRRATSATRSTSACATTSSPGRAREEPAERRRPPAAAPASARRERRPPPAAGRARAARRPRRDRGARGTGRLELPGGRVLELGNLNKPLWPKLGLTKGDLLRYYVDGRAAPPAGGARPAAGHEAAARRRRRAVLLPAPRARRGAAGRARRGRSPATRRPAGFIGGSLATLLYMTQLAVILAGPVVRAHRSPAEMDFAAIDLDPMDGAPFSRVRDVARWVKRRARPPGGDRLPQDVGRERPAHLPADAARARPYEAGMLFCRISPSWSRPATREAATVERAVKKRDPTTVYVDYLQNVPGKTLACAYSARASDYAGASTPLAWDELDDGPRPAATSPSRPSPRACARSATSGSPCGARRASTSRRRSTGSRPSAARRNGAEPARARRERSLPAETGGTSTRDNFCPSKAPAMRSKISFRACSPSPYSPAIAARAEDDDAPTGSSRRGGHQGAHGERSPHRQDRDHARHLHLRALREAGAHDGRELRGPRARHPPLGRIPRRQLATRSRSTTVSSSTV